MKEYEVPKKLGAVAKTKNDEFVLVNEFGKAFHTNEVLLILWKLSDGNRTLQDIYNILRISDLKDISFKKVSAWVKKLYNAGLVKFHSNSSSETSETSI